MNLHLTSSAFRECALAALEELDACTETTDIRRVDAWVDQLSKKIRVVQSDFAGEELGARDPDAEDISYGDMSVDLGDEAADLDA
jgi:hypothetical protein